MFSAIFAFILLGMTVNAQSITVTPGLTATQMAQALVGSNVTVTNGHKIFESTNPADTTCTDTDLNIGGVY